MSATVESSRNRDHARSIRSISTPTAPTTSAGSGSGVLIVHRVPIASKAQ
ncbi:hypothetical protein [Gordonia sp. KTR9]|nr:hypothetical protein [Gordonia sp. KTR9]